MLPNRLADIVRSAGNYGLFWRNETAARPSEIAAAYFKTDVPTIREADVLAGETGTNLEQAVVAVKIGRMIDGTGTGIGVKAR